MTIESKTDHKIDFDKLKEKMVQEVAQMTPEELFEQRVSGVYGLMSSKSKVTKDEIRQEIRKMNPGLSTE